MERVQKLIANSGLCSRRKAEELIAKRKVSVNGHIIKLGDQANATDKILVNGKPLQKQKLTYLILNKPSNYVTSASDRQRTVMELINTKERVFPVGRLDKDAEGLLLFTNDGEIANKIMHPRYEVRKSYYATLDKNFEKQHAKLIEKGIRLKDGKTAPAQVKIINKDEVQITIHEGKNKIVKRIFNALGYRVLRLKRTRVANLTLKDLKRGRWRYLKASELAKLKTILNHG